MPRAVRSFGGKSPRTLQFRQLVAASVAPVAPQISTIKLQSDDPEETGMGAYEEAEGWNDAGVGVCGRNDSGWGRRKQRGRLRYRWRGGGKERARERAGGRPPPG